MFMKEIKVFHRRGLQQLPRHQQNLITCINYVGPISQLIGYSCIIDMILGFWIFMDQFTSQTHSFNLLPFRS